jgi:hypothetical protein
MLKVIALTGIFVFTSAVSTAAVKEPPRKAQKKVTSTQTPAPSPQPKGFCWPPEGGDC